VPSFEPCSKNAQGWWLRQIERDRKTPSRAVERHAAEKQEKWFRPTNATRESSRAISGTKSRWSRIARRPFSHGNRNKAWRYFCAWPSRISGSVLIAALRCRTRAIPAPPASGKKGGPTRPDNRHRGENFARARLRRLRLPAKTGLQVYRSTRVQRRRIRLHDLHQNSDAHQRSNRRSVNSISWRHRSPAIAISKPVSTKTVRRTS
jgi:hypothetical protein